MSQVHLRSRMFILAPRNIHFVSVGASHFKVESSRSFYLASYPNAVKNTRKRKLLRDLMVWRPWGFLSRWRESRQKGSLEEVAAALVPLQVMEWGLQGGHFNEEVVGKDGAEDWLCVWIKKRKKKRHEEREVSTCNVRDVTKLRQRFEKKFC